MATPTVTVNLTGDDRDLSRAFRSARGAIDRFGDQADRTRRGPLTRLRSATGKLVERMDALGKLAGGAQVLGGVARFGVGIAGAAAELEALAGKAEVVFGDTLGQVQEWADESARAMGLGKMEAVGLAAGFADLLKPMGFTAEAAAEMSTETLGLAGALSEWSAGQVNAAEVADILSKAMLGERDGLKQLGIAISQADVDARLAAKGQDELTGALEQQAIAVATQELILEKSLDAQKAFAEGSDTIGRKLAELGGAWEDLKTALLQNVGIPILEVAVPAITGALIPALDVLGETAKRWFGRAKELGASWVEAFRTAPAESRIGRLRKAWETGTAAIGQILDSAQGVWDAWGRDVAATVADLAGELATELGEIAADVLDWLADLAADIEEIAETGDWSIAWDRLLTTADDTIMGLEAVILDGLAAMTGNTEDEAGNALDAWARSIFDRAIAAARDQVIILGDEVRKGLNEFIVDLIPGVTLPSIPEGAGVAGARARNQRGVFGGGTLLDVREQLRESAEAARGRQAARRQQRNAAALGPAAPPFRADTPGRPVTVQGSVLAERDVLRIVRGQERRAPVGGGGGGSTPAFFY